jgi:hypothetical protein
VPLVDPWKHAACDVPVDLTCPMDVSSAVVVATIPVELTGFTSRAPSAVRSRMTVEPAPLGPILAAHLRDTQLRRLASCRPVASGDLDGDRDVLTVSAGGPVRHQNTGNASAFVARTAATTRSAPTASVVIPCFNRFDLLEPVLAAFVREWSANAFQLVLVDDGSEPTVDSLVRTMGIEDLCEVVRRPNGGRGAALNDGLARATGDVVIFCDSDIVPEPGFVADHVAFHADSGDERATHLGALAWGVDAGLAGALFGARSNPRLRGGTRRVKWTQWFTDNWSFRRSLFQQLDLRFDLAYRAWGFEELDLARALVRAGATNTLTERAQGRHLKPPTIEGLRANFARSVPNLLHLASKAPDDRDVRYWLSARAEECDVERAERAFDHAWTRLRELDARHAASSRDVAHGPTNALAIALSDATFYVGIARGLVRHAELAAARAELLPRASATKLFGEVEQFALRVEAAERRCGASTSPPDWLASVAHELGWDAKRHPLRERWVARAATR